MKHKTLSILLAVLMSMVASVASGHDFEVDGIYYSITSSTDLTVAVSYKGGYYTSYSNEYTGSVTIPESVTYNDVTYSVTSIGVWAFYDCTGLTSITIPESVTSIGSSAFFFCSRLTSVTIPESVTSIGSSAFNGCRGLTKAEFASIESLCNISFGDAFANPLKNAHHLYIGGEEITSLVVPEGVTAIKDYAFCGCTGLTSVSIGNSVTSIGIWAFYDCTGLTSITIPESVTSIGSSAFFGCI